MSRIPRRAIVERLTDEEHAIRQAMMDVERMPADERLTDALALLQAARDSVADYVDGVATRRSAVVHHGILADGPGGVEWWGYVDPLAHRAYVMRGIDLHVFVDGVDVTHRCREFYDGPGQRWLLLWRADESGRRLVGPLDRLTEFEVRVGATPIETLDAAVIDALDPGIRDLVVRLRAAGFETTDSGDGVSKPPEWFKSGDALPFPHVSARGQIASVAIDGHRMVEMCGPGWEVEASYSTRDKRVVLFAWQPQDGR